MLNCSFKRPDHVAQWHHQQLSLWLVNSMIPALRSSSSAPVNLFRLRSSPPALIGCCRSCDGRCGVFIVPQIKESPLSWEHRRCVPVFIIYDLYLCVYDFIYQLRLYYFNVTFFGSSGFWIIYIFMYFYRSVFIHLSV